MVKIEDVHLWWVEGGKGHVLLSETVGCECGRCPRFTALCGHRGSSGELTGARPDRPCVGCLVTLLTVRRADYTGTRMRTAID